MREEHSTGFGDQPVQGGAIFRAARFIALRPPRTKHRSWRSFSVRLSFASSIVGCALIDTAWV